jgi:glutamyl/glutaminyl-tRNA synthetase
MTQINVDLWKVPNALHKTLDNFEGKIVTRFPPEPSGYLHIGHIKAAFINYVIAKKYGGEIIMRFDDTNPKKESIEYEEAIAEDLLRLGIKANKTTRTSDYFKIMMNYCEQLIKRGLVYIDDTPKEDMAKERLNRIESKNRNNSIEDALDLWNALLWNTIRTNKPSQPINVKSVSVRLKMDMKSNNSALRDPCIFRYIISEEDGHGGLYPSYDFACPIVDSLEGVTHVFRSTEFSERDAQYRSILKMLGLRQPLLFSYGKLSFSDSVMSKRKIKALIEDEKVSGWDDPQLLTIRGVFNRGMHLDPLIEFIAKMGFSKNVVSMSQDKMWVINKKYIDKISTRYFALPKDNAKLWKITGTLGESEKVIDRFIKNPSLGTRTIYFPKESVFIDNSLEFEENEEITLINWSNVIIRQKDILELNHNGSYKTTKQKGVWVSKEQSVNVIIHTYSKDRTNFGPPSTTHFIGEKGMIIVKKGDYIQLLKHGYYMCVDVDGNGSIHLLEIN